jgi:hypothetical protein
LLVLVFAGGIATTGSAQDSFAVFGGSQFTAGRYGGDRAVSTANFAVGAMATVGRWRWWATVPYIFQDAATVRTVGAGMLPVGGAAHTEQSGSASGSAYNGMMGRLGMAGMNNGGSGMTGHAGHGDPLLRADVAVLGSTAASQSLSLYSAVKVPFASAKDGFGTGRWDEAVGATVARHFTTFSVLADVGYWHVGRRSGDPYRDVTSGTVTVARPLGSAGQTLYGSVIAATPFVDGSEGPVQVAAGWSYRFANRQSITAMAGVGLTPTAPAASLSATWQWGLR